MRLPLFSTFVSTEEVLEVAIVHGATHLILEDSKLSIRSFSDDFSGPGFSKVSRLAEMARRLKPDIHLSFNLDVMLHQHHFPLVDVLLRELQACGISTFRIQDPGLFLYVRSLYPEAVFHLATETGNMNQESLQVYEPFAERQCLSAECPADDIENLKLHTRSELEIQVHGPLLIQHSYRRYLAGLPIGAGRTQTIKLAQDAEYKGRYFLFYDNPHGHFMYLYFDRCLIAHIPRLLSLNLASWLIDGRGESLDYLGTVLRLYRQEAQRALQDWDSYALDSAVLPALTQVGRRPLKPGFFVANKTDSDRRVKHKFDTESPAFLGLVLDAVPGKSITVELEKQLPNPAFLKILTPEQKQIDFQISQAWYLDDTPFLFDRFEPLLKLPWKKGVIPKSYVFHEGSDPILAKAGSDPLFKN